MAATDGLKLVLVGQPEAYDWLNEADVYKQPCHLRQATNGSLNTTMELIREVLKDSENLKYV